MDAFIKPNVASGSTIYTNGLKTFTGLSEGSFKHIPHAQALRIDVRKACETHGATGLSRHRQLAAFAHRFSADARQRP
jgi:hypothetical protein